MKILSKLWLSLFTGWFFVMEAIASYPARQQENWNKFWRFYLGDTAKAQSIDFHDEDWSLISLPHSFSIPYFMSKDFYIGYGWYRKELQLKKTDLSRVLTLEFDGVFQEAEVFVNGEKAGTHIGGYTGFTVPISSYVKEGRNVVAIRVNNLWKPDVAPRAGEHVFSGGIYRNVRLVSKDPLHIDWYGVGITTPDLQATAGEKSTVKVTTEVSNQLDQEVHFSLETRLYSPEGVLLQKQSQAYTLKSGSRQSIIQILNAVEHPQLWSPDLPRLYQVESRLYRGRTLVDSTTTEFGFRWFEWTANRGFFLNGQHCVIQGANVHQDQAGWGDAVTEAAMYRDVAMMKEAGFNLIRGSHYPHAPAFSKACDQLGLLFWSEAPFWGIGGFRSDGYWDSSAFPIHSEDESGFEASALQQLTEMIRIHRNHPSIIVWSMCNEAFFSESRVLPGVKRLLKRMVDLTHQLDPSRPAAIGGAQRPLGVNRIDYIGDVAGYNGDGATQADFQHPSIPNMVSEYGSVTSDRPGAYAPGWGDLAVQNGWLGRPWRSGQAIWCGFDHGSIAGSALGKMGIVDYFRIPKRSWYWYRNQHLKQSEPEWPTLGTPVRLQCQASQTENIRTDGTDDVQLMITLWDATGKQVSHSPEVTLRVVEGPGEFPTGKSIRFTADSDIRIQDGQAAIAFRSYYAGSTILEAVSPGLQPARLTLQFIGDDPYVKGKSPETVHRPYVPFVRKVTEPEVQLFGRNNPTFASSSREGFSAGLATDQEEKTTWKSQEADEKPWLMVDTEKKLYLQQIDCLFPEARWGGFWIEVSTDRIHWEILTDYSKGKTHQAKVTWKKLAENRPVSARFVRVRFAGSRQASLSEITIYGIVLQ